MKTAITIEKPFGKWQINGKDYMQCTFLERYYFRLFIKTKRNDL